MADKPSRALVFYGDGLAPFLNPSHTNLHSLASNSNCGFLSLPNSPSSESEDERAIREFACLLDAAEAYVNENGSNTTAAEPQSLSERFMGMKTALFTNNSRLEAFSKQLGLIVHSLPETSADTVVSELLKLLGFQEGKTLEVNEFDLVFVHIDNVELINTLVGGIIQIAKPGSEVGFRLHLSVVMSYGSVSDVDAQSLSVTVPKDEKFSAFIPRQSYTMRGEQERDNVRHHSPMLISQCQHAVTRTDLAGTFSFKDFKESGANLVIPADRFLHEIAFKLWKAPKYGA